MYGTAWQLYCCKWFEAFYDNRGKHPISIEGARAHFEEWAKTNGKTFVNNDHPEKGARLIIGSTGGPAAIMAKMIPTLCEMPVQLLFEDIAYWRENKSVEVALSQGLVLTILGQLKTDWARETGYYYATHIVPA